MARQMCSGPRRDRSGLSAFALGITVGAGLLVAATSARAGDVLVSAGAYWRYDDSGIDLGTAWSDPAYDDSAWPEGAAQLGYGDGDELTLLDYGGDTQNKIITYYFRRTFQVNDASAYESLVLRLVRDDGCIIRLNGVEIGRSAMPDGAVDWLTLASETAATATENDVIELAADAAALEDGENVLAVEVHQVSVSSTDISFDLEVEALVPAPVVVLDSPEDGATVRDTLVSFECSATDSVGLFDAVLYIGGEPDTLVFRGPAETEDATLSATDPGVNAGDDVMLYVDGEGPHAHAVIRFPGLFDPGAGVPLGSEIVSATLELECTNVGDTLEVRRLMEGWVESEVTWNERSSGVDWSVAGAEGGYSSTSSFLEGPGSPLGTLSIDVTSIVQSWSDGDANHGFLLSDSDIDGVDVSSSEGTSPPALTVTYAPAWQLVESQPLSGNADSALFQVELADQDTYVWNCRVSNIAGGTAWASGDRTVIVDTHVPDAPTVEAPEVGAVDVSTSASLEVSVNDPDGDALEVTFYGRSADAPAPFTLVVLPDTQKYAASAPDVFTSQTRWIVDNVSTLAIPFVTHEGDVVDDPASVDQWENADASMGLLDGVVPYAVLPGNHDQPTTLYNQYFPESRFSAETWYGEGYPAGQNDNSYQLFSAGGIDFVILHLEFCPSTDVIEWADGILGAFPERTAIITTHGYMDGTGALSVHSCADTSYIRDSLVVPHENVRFVLCGHVHAEHTRSDQIGDRVVHQLLADYQDLLPTGGEGYLRLMTFLPDQDRVHVETYSPWLGAPQTDTDSDFHLDFEMRGFRELGVVTGVSSGGTASFRWEDLEPFSGYEWYAVATDSTDRESSSVVAAFTTGSGDTEPPVITGVGTMGLTDTTVTILWTTDEPADSTVSYGPDATYGAQATDGALVTSHAVTLTGLDPDSTYHFQVTSADASANAAFGSDETFTTLPENHPPVADTQSHTMDEDGSLILTLTASDPDPDTTFTFAIASAPTSGQLTGTPPHVTYEPDADYFGPDSFTFTASDGIEVSAPATVSIEVLAQPDAPEAIAQSVSTAEETSLEITLAGQDADQEPITFAIASLPLHGVLTGTPPSVTYNPAVDWDGPDSFTFTVNDGTSTSDPATVSIDVTAVNDPPVVSDRDLLTDEDTAAGITLTAQDPDSTGLTFEIVDAPGHGTLSGDAPALTYSPAADYHGPDTFTYRASDGVAQSGVGTVSIEVASVDDVPTVPAGLVATGSADGVSLQWDDASDADGDLVGYRVYRAETSGGQDLFGVPLASPTASEHPDTSAALGTTYYYIVTAVDGGGHESAPSAEVFAAAGETEHEVFAASDPVLTFGTFTGAGVTGTHAAGDGSTQSIQESPNGVAGMASLLAEYTIRLPVSAGEVTSLGIDFVVTWPAQDPDDPLVVTIARGGVWEDITSAALSGVFDATGAPSDYVDTAGDVRIRFADTAAIKRESKDTVTIDFLRVRVTGGVPDTTPPSVPSGLVATGDDATLQVSLDWDDNTGDTDLSHYEVLRSTTPGGGYELITPSGVSESAHVDEPGAPGSYYYVVRAVDLAGNASATGGEASVTLADLAPASPTGLSAAAGDAVVSLDWSDSGEPDLDGYRVYRSSASGGPYTEVTDPEGDPIGASTFDDTTVVNGTTYYWVVTAIDLAGGESAYSSEVSATPEAGGTTPSIHVADISFSFVPVRNKYVVEASVRVEDGAGAVAAGAEVTGDWYFKGALLQAGVFATTDATGVAVVESAQQRAKTGDVFEFRVTGVTLAGYEYRPEDNVETSDSAATP